MKTCILECNLIYTCTLLFSTDELLKGLVSRNIEKHITRILDAYSSSTEIQKVLHYLKWKNANVLSCILCQYMYLIIQNLCTIKGIYTAIYTFKEN